MQWLKVELNSARLIAQTWHYYVVQKALGSENNAGGVGTGALKSGRRRWGQTVAKTSDSWEESDRSETSASNSKKPSLVNTEEEKSPKDQCPQ